MPKKQSSRTKARSRPIRRLPAPRTLIYGLSQDSVVFADEKRAQELAAFWTAKTWGALRVGCPKLYRHLVRSARDNGRPQPNEQQSFVAGEIDAVGDGDFPGWLLQEMEAILPKPVAARFTELFDSVLNGTALMIPPEREAAVVKAMRALGYRCVKNQRLISRAAGD